jgi:hypothetical protein
MPPNYDQIFPCLEEFEREFERELVRVGARHCDHLQCQNPLTASFFFCCVRDHSFAQSSSFTGQ